MLFNLHKFRKGGLVNGSCGTENNGMQPTHCRVMLLPSWAPLLSVKISYLFLIGEQFLLYCNSVGSPRWRSGRVHLPVQETQVHSLGWEHPLEQEIATHSLILPGEFCE